MEVKHTILNFEQNISKSKYGNKGENNIQMDYMIHHSIILCPCSDSSMYGNICFPETPFC